MTRTRRSLVLAGLLGIGVTACTEEMVVVTPTLEPEQGPAFALDASRAEAGSVDGYFVVVFRGSRLPHNADRIVAGRSAMAVNRANHRQRALGSLPLGNSRSKNTIRPRPKIPTQEVSQANASPPGRDRDGASKSYAAYSALKWDTPKVRPIAQNSHPIGLSGRRLATTAPTVE
jgi:hypothetical protein